MIDDNRQAPTQKLQTPTQELAGHLQQINDAGYKDTLGFAIQHNQSWVRVVEIVTVMLNEEKAGGE